MIDLPRRLLAELVGTGLLVAVVVGSGIAASDTFAGISPASLPGFVIAQLIGGVLGAGLVLALYPDADMAAACVVVPHPATPDPGGATHDSPCPLPREAP